MLYVNSMSSLVIVFFQVSTEWIYIFICDYIHSYVIVFFNIMIMIFSHVNRNFHIKNVHFHKGFSFSPYINENVHTRNVHLLT